MSLASPRGRRSYSRSRSPGPGREYRDPGGEENVGTVFVGNLNHETTEKSLRDFFETYGRVLETKIVHDIETGRSRGFGFVKFEDARDADDAIAEADGRTLEGRHIKCNMAKYSRGGGFRGGPPPGPGGGSFRGDFRGGYRGGDRGGFRGRMGPPMRGGYHHGTPSYNEGRPAERAPPRRSRSPSLGRYSPGRYTSPPRSPGRFAPVTRKRKVPGSPGGSYTSDSKSSGSYSTTDSEGDSKSPRRRAVRPRPAGEVPQIAAPPTAPPTRLPDQGAIKNELVQARRRESEMSTRMAALEAEVKQSKVTREDQTAKINELIERVQKAEGDVKQYRKWFHAMCKYSREVLLAQQATKQAEEEAKLRAEDLALFLQEADNFVAKEKGKSGRRRRKDAEGVALEGEEGAMVVANAPEAGGEALAIDTPQAMQPSGGIQNGMP